MIIIQNSKKFQEFEYEKEEDLEKEIVDNFRLLFGEDTIYINAKKKIEAKALGGSVPDGLLFDLSDKEEPEFYIVEVELKKHDFFKHIFPQITKFFAFFKNKKSQGELIEKIFSIVNNSDELKKDFKKYLGENEIYKFLKDTVEDSQNILLIIDGEKEEFPEITETYSDTWGKMVKKLILKKFVHDKDSIYTIEPDFKNIEYPILATDETQGERETEYTEEFHLEGVNSEIKTAYFKIKEELLRINESLVFNPQKYYISIVYKKNIAYFELRKKKIRFVIVLPEDEVRKRIKSHLIKHLSEGIQKFYNRPSCMIIIESSENLDEIINLFNILIKNSTETRNDPSH